MGRPSASFSVRIHLLHRLLLGGLYPTTWARRYASVDSGTNAPGVGRARVDSKLDSRAAGDLGRSDGLVFR